MSPSISFALARYVAAAAMAMTLAATPPARARMVPSFDTGKEDTLLSLARVPSGGQLVGSWRRHRKGHELVGPAGKRWGAWFPAGDRAQIADGTVRARFHASKRARVAVMVRATAPGGVASDGIRVRLSDRRLHLERLKGGEAKALVPSERVGKLRGDEVEILVTVMGPHILARVYDGDRQKLLGSIHAMDSSHLSGRVGVLVETKRAKYGRPTLVATRPACRRTPNPAGERGPPLYVTLPTTTVGMLHGIAGEEMERLSGRPARSVWRMDSLDLEQVRCQTSDPVVTSLETPFKYKDRAYRKLRKRPPQLTKEGHVALDRSYKSPAMVGDILQAWRARYPELTRLERMGTSHQGRPIWAMLIGRDLDTRPDRPTVFLNGAHHGNEPLSVEFVLDAMDVLLRGAGVDASVDRWLDSYGIWCMPVVNPDGLYAYMEHTTRTGRKNGRDHDGDGQRGRLEGVDINRNYPFRWASLGERGSRSRADSVYYRGPAPASEPEVQAVMALASRERFVASVTYHTGTVALLAPYTIEGVADPVVNEAWTIAEEMAKILPRHPQDRAFKVKRNLYPVDGTDQDWHRAAHGTLALLVEGARWTPRSMGMRSRIVTAVRPTWTYLLDRFLDGPSVSVRVVDREAQPVLADVRIVEMAQRAGERWTTRCPTGRHDRFVAAPGTYTIEVRAQGQDVVRKTVAVEAGRTEVTVVLTTASEGAACVRPGPDEESTPAAE